MIYNKLQKKILILGLGSAGLRYYRILKKLKFENIYTFSEHISNSQSIKSIKEIKNLNPDFVFICSETYKHYSQLKRINNILSGKNILVEKPLFHKDLKIPKINNNIFIGFNLRFHPVFEFISKKIKYDLENFYDLKFTCYSYLPKWRKKNYKNSYSSSKKKGGGVINDLSHEIDMAINIVKKFSILQFSYSKISDLISDTEDNFYVILKKKKNQKIQIDLNYYSRIEKRQIEFISSKQSIVGDLITNEVKIKTSKTVKAFKIKPKLNTYQKLVNDFIFNKGKRCAKFEDGLKVNKFIGEVKR